MVDWGSLDRRRLAAIEEGEGSPTGMGVDFVPSRVRRKRCVLGRYLHVNPSCDFGTVSTLLQLEQYFSAMEKMGKSV
jgi:hypothetical protein